MSARSRIAARAAAILVASVLAALLVPGRAHAEHDALKGTPVVVFLVNGYGGCCIPGSVRTMLRQIYDQSVPPKRLVAVHVSNWNEINQQGHPGEFPLGGFPDPYTDETFIEQMEEEVAEIDELFPETKLVLIGHSFGGDSVLQVARRLDGPTPGTRREIAFLAVLDPVGRAGLRANVTGPVPSNVEYFYNRWQTNFFYPIDFPASGHIESHADDGSQHAQSLRKTRNCKVKYTYGVIPELMLHAQVPNDSCVQAQLKRVIEGRLLNPNPRVVSASVVFGPAPMRPITGVRVRFSEPISILSFTTADTTASPRPPTSVEAIPSSGGHDFLVSFEPFVLPEAVARMRVDIGPDVHDLDGNPMDQDLDLRPGETNADRYTFEHGNGSGSIVIPKVVFLKFVIEAQGRLKKIIAITLRFDRSVLRAVATDLANYRLVSPGRDNRFGTIDDRPVSIGRAVYDAGSHVVTLTPRTPLVASETFQLVVEGPGLTAHRAVFGGTR